MKCIKNWVNASKIVYASFLLDEGVKYDQTCLYQKCSINKGYKQCHPGIHTYLIHICHHFWYQPYGGFPKKGGYPVPVIHDFRSFQYKPSSLLGTPWPHGHGFPPFLVLSPLNQDQDAWRTSGWPLAPAAALRLDRTLPGAAARQRTRGIKNQRTYGDLIKKHVDFMRF